MWIGGGLSTSNTKATSQKPSRVTIQDTNKSVKGVGSSPLNNQSSRQSEPSETNVLTRFTYTHTYKKTLFNKSLDTFFLMKSLTLLNAIYPKSCNCSKPNLVFLKVKNRPSMARCSHCHKQVSITANTPFQGYQSNLAYISFIIWDMVNQYPKVMTSNEISRKLNLSYKTSYYLKKRIQVIFSQLNDKLRKELFEELKNTENTDQKPIAVADSVVLFSASLKANKYRSRRYKTGTASIYLSNNLQGRQVGCLVHTIGINHGMTFYTSIPLNNQHYLENDLNEKIPKNVTLYTDEGYTFLWDRPNHKMVNHSKKSKDPRYNLSRDRWVTREGVSNNGAESRNNILKQSFRSYGYISPRWSQLYLNELSFLSNLKFKPELRNLLSLGDDAFVLDVNRSGLVPQEGIEPPLSVPKTDVLSVELPGHGDGMYCQDKGTLSSGK